MDGEQRQHVAKQVRREQGLLAVCITLLLLATIPPLINLGRFQHRIAGAIGRSIGRPITTGAISLRLLPWPAFQIENLSVGEDSPFGAEPALLAPQVIAEPRFSSLWRGRFELSRIELTDASVNLVRNANGRWNVSSVLLQASHIPNAPTGQPRPGAAPRFPYIEATSTRINFKRESEKLPYSLLNADFSMWSDRPGVWQVRLEGQPVRTDLEISQGDTGLLRLDGELDQNSVRGASELGTMPLKMTGEWSRVPLGQLSRLLLDRDTGWRGDIDLTAKFEGEMDRLDVRTHLQAANLHRQEFTPEQPFPLDASCSAHYSRADDAKNSLLCRWPLGGGALTLMLGAGEPAFTLTADKVPAGFFASIADLLHQGAPAAQFAGEVSGGYRYEPTSKLLTGSLVAESLSLAEAGLHGEPLLLEDVRLTASRGLDRGLDHGPEPMLLFSTAPVALGAAGAPMVLGAELTPHGYTLHANGGASLLRMQAMAARLHLPAMSQLTALPKASAEIALSTSAPWGPMWNALGSGLENQLENQAATGLDGTANGPGGLAAHTTGTVHLANVRWQPLWLSVPVDLQSADGSLGPGTLHWSTASASIGKAGEGRLRLAGSAEFPLHCQVAAACVTHFSLSTPTLDGETLQAVFHNGQNQLLSSLLSHLNASRTQLPLFEGSLHVGLLTLGRLPVHGVVASLSTGISDGTDGTDGTDAAHTGETVLTLRNLDGTALGGNLHLGGTIALSGDAPHYRLQTRLHGASAVQAAALWHESWGPGTLDGTAELEFAGTNAGELMSSSKGSFQALWTRGDLPPALPRFTSWDGTGTIDSEGLQLTQSTLSCDPHALTSTPAGTLTGSIGWDRTLALKRSGTPDAPPDSITGTLAAPLLEPNTPDGQVSPASPAQ